MQRLCQRNFKKHIRGGDGTDLIMGVGHPYSDPSIHTYCYARLRISKRGDLKDKISNKK